MTMYQGLSQIYDLLMDSIDYEEWAQYIDSLTEKYQVEKKNALDIACGTGSTTIPLAKRGWRMTGVDLSLPMLLQARKKAGEANLDIIFLQQDIRNLEATREYNLVTCFQDGLNYLLTAQDLEKTFQEIYNVLSPEGVFIFDLNLVEKYASAVQGDVSFVDMDAYSLIYETAYDPENEIWEIKVTGFVKEDQIYTKFQEIHQEKQHDLNDVEKSLQTIGFEILDIFEAFSMNPPQADTRRIFVAARKNGGRS